MRKRLVNIIMYAVEGIVLMLGFVAFWWKSSVASEYIGTKAIGTFVQGLVAFVICYVIVAVFDMIREDVCDVKNCL